MTCAAKVSRCVRPRLWQWECLDHMCGAGHLNSRRNLHRRHKQEIKIAVLPFSRRGALRVLGSFARPAIRSPGQVLAVLFFMKMLPDAYGVCISLYFDPSGFFMAFALTL